MARQFPRLAAGLLVTPVVVLALTAPARSEASPEAQEPPVAVGTDSQGENSVPLVRAPGDTPEATVTPEEAAGADASGYAEDQGITLSQARSALAVVAEASDALARLEAAFPNTFAGGWIEHQPTVRGVALFTGEVPREARAVAGVPAADLEARGGAARSLRSLDEAAREVLDSLAISRRTVATTFDIRSSMVEASVQRLPEEAGISAGALRDGLPARARAEDVVVRFMDGPVAGGYHTRGGAMTPGDNGGYCTTGFSVAKDGVYGFVTAGHCSNARDYQEPGGGLRYNAPFQSPQHRGAYGDLQWHTTPHTEYAQFYSGNTAYRDVHGGDYSLYEDDYVCKYGRKTGYGCTYIYRTSIYVIFDGIKHERLVATTGDVIDYGDSGGPWFLNNSAIGVTSGWWDETSTRQRSTFSRVGYMDDALGLSLLVR